MKKRIIYLLNRYEKKNLTDDQVKNYFPKIQQTYLDDFALFS